MTFRLLTPEEWRQGQLKAQLAELLKNREIERLALRAETREIAPENGLRKHEFTGRWFMTLSLTPKGESITEIPK